MKKLLKAEIVLLTQSAQMLTPIQITYDDKKIDPNPKYEISLIYDAVEYSGTGKDYLWTDTLADLQVNLPKDVRIACCMTCKHGNMCPYGNPVNQLFCTKDCIINSKEDMCRLFDQTNPFDERAVAALSFCQSFEYQNDGYYTYNDYLYHLNQKNKNAK